MTTSPARLVQRLHEANVRVALPSHPVHSELKEEEEEEEEEEDEGTFKYF